MFTVDSAVDTAVKNTKSMLSYVPQEEVRSSFETLIEAQAAYTKTFFNTGVELANLAKESVTKYVGDNKFAKK